MSVRALPASPRAALLRRMAPLTAGHLVTDIAQGALPALLPALRSAFHLSYAQIGGTLLAATVASSITQPLLGLWSDSRGASWLLPAGPLVAGIGVGLLGIVPAYAAVLAAVLVSGLGVAAYHPEATKHAAWISGARRSTAMSLFSVGGNVGIALGPLLAGLVLALLGLHGAVLLAVPGVLMVAPLVRYARDSVAPAAFGARGRGHGGRDRWGATLLLLASVTARGYVHFALLGYVVLLEQARGHSAGFGAVVLSLVLAAGAVGTLLIGPLADRRGRRQVLVASFAVCVPAVALYVWSSGPAGIVGAAVAGACLISTFGVTIVLSQEYLPQRLGLAAGLSVGLSIGLGGLSALAIGVLADTVGLQQALWTAPAAALVGLALTALLPDPESTP